MPRHSFLTILTGLFLTIAASAQAEPTEKKPFLQTYCMDCHDSEMHEGGLDLEKLKFQPAQRANALLWEHLFDRVSHGEMPPKNKPQPSPEERQAALDALSASLRAASLASQKKEGRGPVRRLTRSEYENTLTDLLSLPCDVRNLFPDDAVTAGFDKVGEGLTLSATHFARYQEAADKVLGIAMTHAGSLKFEKNGIQFFEGKETMASYGNWTEDNNLVLTSQLFFPYTAILGPWVPFSGKYRVRITGQARNNEGKPVPVGIGILSRNGSKPDAPDLSDWRDLTEKEMSTVTMDLDVQKDDQIHIFGPTLMHRDYVIPGHKKGERWARQTLVIQKIVIEGPIKDDGSPATRPLPCYQTLFSGLKDKSLSEITGIPAAKGMPNPVFPVSPNPAGDAERLLRDFLPKAFRRPVPEDMAKPYLDAVKKSLSDGILFHQAMLDTYKAILCSPHFLLHEEAPGPLDNASLANRMAYFLWNGPPDDALLQADLSQPKNRHDQVERLLQDPRSARFERSFIDQWLDLKKIDDTSPDSKLYPEFNTALQLSAVRETELVFHELIAENRSLLEGVKSDWTYANAPLGWLYGLPEIIGYNMRRITLPPGSQRGGFLTQASILKVTADGAKTSPIIRGNWINEKILGIHPPPPPPNIPKIEPDIRGATTIRAQLAKHRATPACMSCHTVIDPPGFALETFDVIGGRRDFYRGAGGTGIIEILPSKKKVHRGPAVEVGYTMPDGRAFADVDEYRTMLLEDKDALVRALTNHLLVYATGARIQFADRDDVTAIVNALRTENNGFRSLIHRIVESRPFLNK